MHGDWPRFHAFVQTYKMFISEYFHGGLLINMLKALGNYLPRNVIKDPNPTTIDDAIKLTWEVFRADQPPVPQLHVAPSVVPHYPAVAPPIHVSVAISVVTELDILRQANSYPCDFFSV